MIADAAGGRGLRVSHLVTPVLGLVIAAVMFALLGWILRGHDDRDLSAATTIDNVALARPAPPQQPPAPQDIAKAVENAPPPPPMAPPALGRPDLPALDVPALAIQPVAVGNITVPVALGDFGQSLGKVGAFGGFGSGGGGSGSGAGGGAGVGGGGGAGWKGKPLVPISTARPQMPEWACKQKLDGWVEAIFTVMPNGHVQDVRIVDADPRGVFEAAAVESIGNWLYDPTGKAAEVKQRVPMNHDDCQYNWR